MEQQNSSTFDSFREALLGDRSTATGSQQLRPCLKEKWEPDLPACSLCLAAFNTFKRRHHCRVCGRVLCKTCCPHRVSISGLPTLQRGCVTCIQAPGKNLSDEVDELTKKLCQLTRENEALLLQQVRAERETTLQDVARRPIKLHVGQMSGASLGTVHVGPAWTAREVRAAVMPLLSVGLYIVNLVLDGGIFEEAMTVESAGLKDGSKILAVVHMSDFIVSGAGSAEVNGHYVNSGEVKNGQPCYTNDNGVLLHRYMFGNGAFYWYFSAAGQISLDKSGGDFYRIKTAEVAPPKSGWVNDKCPCGKHPAPCVLQPPGAHSPEPPDSEPSSSSESE